ncbi:sensor histidine kinase inhibitor, KipI family [Marivirga sericea]|uniref:Sensor histidine kinase inhibitor, KipI family n=1 Tax=Marivirga sericea TaxID=1028 RepID=A0A1X7IJE7_9BACT|nr:5-oxoprolinase subunit PxpB [Marivirga sericea]SMG14851.1 sensor histidine kinase inhibitor, KipI family [Marivirga sericea]
MMKIRPYGSHALLINFEQKIDLEIHHLVKGYFNAISEFEEVSYQIPAYCSITVVFDKKTTDYEHLKSKIELLEIEPSKTTAKTTTIEIPVCYEAAYAPDLASLAQELNLKPEEVISLHTAETYDVYMMGFLPGFPYLGKLPVALECKRKSTPRKQVKAGNVGLAGQQTGIYPSDAPGGWQLIGQTPLKIFDPHRKDAFLLKMGDRVQFKSINAETYIKIKQDVE